MSGALFLQSQVADPYAFYADRLARAPLTWDDANGIWAAYSYAGCRRLLDNAAARIPASQPIALQSLDTHAAIIVRNLARLANPPLHAALRQVALRLYERVQPADTAALMQRLIGAHNEVDWVDAVCRKLPALVLLEGLGFGPADAAAIMPRIDALTKLMLPNRSAQQLVGVNAAADAVYPLVQRHLHEVLRIGFDTEAERSACVANLIGLLIQSHDAGRGLLSNTLLQLLRQPRTAAHDTGYLQRAVVETLRFDPPIHNTRRIAAEDILLDGQTIRKGQAMLLVLAAANRDPAQFAHPDRYDVGRGNNHEHLTFGAGAHACVAARLSLRITVDALQWLLDRYPGTRLLEAEMRYEPLVNARLPCRIGIAFAT
jgi:cytochrome P450